MLILGICDTDTMKWCQVLSGGRRYTCRIKEFDGTLHFFFKKAWHPVATFVSERAEVLVGKGGRVYSIPFKKYQ